MVEENTMAETEAASETDGKRERERKIKGRKVH